MVGVGGISIARGVRCTGCGCWGTSRSVLLACVSPNLDVPDEQVDVPDAWPDWVSPALLDLRHRGETDGVRATTVDVPFPTLR